jgi:hypothetical protein
MELGEPLVGDLQLDAPRRIGLEQVDELPGMTRGGIFSSSARSVNDGTSPSTGAGSRPAPTSTATTSG